MPIPTLLEPTPLTNPPVYRLTPEGRKYLKDLLESQYLSRFINFPPLRLPVPPRPTFNEEPEPETNIPLEDALQRSLLGELLIHALGDPQPSKISIVNEIKKEKLDVEVVKKMLGEFGAGMEILKEELATLELRGK